MNRHKSVWTAFALVTVAVNQVTVDAKDTARRQCNDFDTRPFPMCTQTYREEQVTHGRYGHILTNIGAWSPDSLWLVYDTRSDAAGVVFDGSRIEAVNVDAKEVRVLYEARSGAHCGVVTHNPVRDEVVFILGPEHPTADWSYSAFHRQGVVVDRKKPDAARNLDACDLTPPFTPGALRGGSHVHVFSPDGQWVSFTYEDHVLAQFKEASAENDVNLRGVAVSAPIRSVQVKKDHPRNHDGECFTAIVTRTTAKPKPGSDEITRACEDAWIGNQGYLRADGRRQRRALAFQGTVVASNGDAVSELFVVDLPDDLTVEGDGPLCGTAARMPFPPKGCTQRRLTYTADRKFPGLQGPRHWPRSSPDGSRIAFLMKDDAGIVQLWTISPSGGLPVQLTHNPWSISSAFSWSPDGRSIAHTMDNSVFVTDAAAGRSARVTTRSPDECAPRPEACAFSPDGRKIAYVRPVPSEGRTYNQIFVAYLAN